MITLNSDKGLVLVESWDDVTTRPGFDGNLDPTAVELESILGSYVFRDYITCGLTSCRQPHGKGYLVKAKNGRETNIGKDCGKNHFGVDFETLRKTYDRDLLNATRRQRLGEIQNRAQHYLDTIDQLRHGQIGADWVYRIRAASPNRMWTPTIARKTGSVDGIGMPRTTVVFSFAMLHSVKPGWTKGSPMQTRPRVADH
jgi:hypothetical protein